MAGPRWRQKGTVCLWRFSPHGGWSAWQMAADKEACDAIIELLNIMRAVAAREAVAGTMAVSKPSSSLIDGVRRGYRRPIETVSLFQIRTEPDYPADHWIMSLDESTLTLAIGSGYFSKLEKSMEEIRDGPGDFSIGKRRQWSLMFWRL